MPRILLTTFSLLAFFTSSQALEVTFNQNAQVDDTIIRLGDVAKYDEQSPLAEALASQPVGQAPPPGETLVLRSHNIRQSLLASNHSLPSDTSWSGSPIIHVSRRGISVDSGKIQAVISQFLSNNKNNLPKADIKFVPISLPLPFTVPTGALTYDVIPSNPGILSSSSFSIIFKVDDKVVKNMSVRGKIEAMAKVVVAAEPLPKGLILRPQHLNVVAMDIGDLTSPELDTENLLGMQLTKALATGSPVLRSNVETLPLVKRGQKVKMIVETGSLQVTASGFAHTDGKLDQMIKIQNINSNKTVHGRVAGPGVVEVIL